jgi:hypothetical protein
VTVAVTDSGVEVAHPELIGELAVKASEPFNGRTTTGTAWSTTSSAGTS